ncbi:MAG: exported protein of unknown function [Candidatus Saccharibacteria bacterium]|nr:exported protein of unknown function [Candidatus Saccharibacteria bacterium]
MKNHHKSFTRIFSASILVAAILVQTFQASTVSAAQITNRKLTLIGVGTNGGSKPNVAANHLFNFTLAGGTDTGSIKFQYCTTAAPVAGGIDCNLPAGTVTTGSTLGSETGATGFTNIDNSTNGTTIISRTSASAASGAVAYQLNNVINPNTNTTFFVRISTHNALDGTGAAIDSGTVTAATTNPIDLSGTMPESLVFCAAETIGLNGGVPDCATATDATIAFNQLFSPTDTATASSQLVASTNAGAGYAIAVHGTTLTSGSNTISPIGATAAGIRGVSQFGLNLKANTTATSTTPVGAEVAVASNGTNYRGQASDDYKVIDNFKFVSSNIIANSASNGNDLDAIDTPGGSDAQIFTVSYMVNVPGSQPAGTYTTTLTYICTPTF